MCSDVSKHTQMGHGVVSYEWCGDLLSTLTGGYKQRARSQSGADL